MKTKIICLLLILANISAIFAKDCNGLDKFTKDCPPTAEPTWPNQFEQSFDQTFWYPIIGSQKTTGKIYYDWTNQRYRIDRANGHYDRYCLPIYPFSNTPCQHIVVAGRRYLNFPEKNYCCYCCSADHGCGILKPNWLSEAVFEDYVEENGAMLERWNKKGLQDNLYFQDAKSKIMKRIDQKPNDLQDYDVSSYHSGISDPSVFDLPEGCENTTCPTLSICSTLR